MYWVWRRGWSRMWQREGFESGFTVRNEETETRKTSGRHQKLKHTLSAGMCTAKFTRCSKVTCHSKTHKQRKYGKTTETSFIFFSLQISLEKIITIWQGVRAKAWRSECERASERAAVTSSQSCCFYTEASHRAKWDHTLAILHGCVVWFRLCRRSDGVKNLQVPGYGGRRGEGVLQVDWRQNKRAGK